MRKVILALAMVLILPVVFQSCKNDDNNEFSLVGTEWVYKLTIMDTEIETHLKFLDATRMQILYFQDGEESEDPEMGTYTVSGSKIVLTSEDGSTLSGTINGNKMTFVDSGMQVVFEKM